MPEAYDFLAENHGSVILLQPLSAAANRWADEHLSHAMRYAGAVVIEPRYFPDIVDGIWADSLTVDG